MHRIRRAEYAPFTNRWWVRIGCYSHFGDTVLQCINPC